MHKTLSFIFSVHLEAESPEEGEIAPPKQFRGIPDSPPPMSEWPPCVRMVPRLDAANLTTDEADGRKNVNVITAEGVEIGRYEGGGASYLQQSVV